MGSAPLTTTSKGLRARSTCGLSFSIRQAMTLRDTRRRPLSRMSAKASRRGKSPLHHRGWLDNFFPDRITRHALTLDGKRYTMVLELPPGPRVFFGPHEIPGLGIAIAVITSGLMCYLLSWSIASPVTRLRQAAQSLAAGDLTARAGAPPSRRHDELTELMRDFDRMAERIESLVDSQSRLLKDVSHELRSPLARLSVALGLARQRATPEVAPELESSLNRIEVEADRLNQLIQRLLTISRLESGTDGLRRSRLSLRELVEQVARDAEYETPGRGCRVTAITTAAGTGTDTDPHEDENEYDEFLVDGDPDLLRSAVENVVRNPRAILPKVRRWRCDWSVSNRPTAMESKSLFACSIAVPAFPTRLCPRSSSPFIGWTMPATARPGARVWDCQSRIAPSGCTVGNFAHPTAMRVGCRWKSGFRPVRRLRGLLFPPIPDKQIYFSPKFQSR